jgi:hypothetical protein
MEPSGVAVKILICIRAVLGSTLCQLLGCFRHILQANTRTLPELGSNRFLANALNFPNILPFNAYTSPAIEGDVN